MATEITPHPQPQLHFVLIPFMAQGHLLPMTDIAKLLARHGVLVTFITTPLNAGRVRSTLARAVAESPAVEIRVEEVEFPCEEGDGPMLPSHCESLDQLPSLGLGPNFFYATDSLRKPIEKLLEGLRPRPSCVVSDMCLPFTAQLAEKFGVPRITFNGFSTFTLLCLRYIHGNNALDAVGLDSEPFIVPGIPDRIELTKNQLPLSMTNGLERFGQQIMVGEELSYGMIVNSFEELDPEYVERYKVLMGGRAWCVGPVSLVNESELDRLQRGDAQNAVGKSECLNWLDLRESSSTIYVCLGSICNIPTRQLIELALGLEASNIPFMWAVRDRGEASKDLWEWMDEYHFEEKTKERGFLIRGWAPQMVILAHQAIGGFLTHCGWNSTLEGISAGVAMLTWPLFGDQFCNERLVVDVLKIGVGIGANNTVKWGEEENVGVLVKEENVKKGVDELMCEGEERDKRRKRVKELSERSKLALKEGGSSYVNIERLKQDIIEQTSIKSS